MTHECNGETGFGIFMSGRARFQVTLIRDETTEAEFVIEYLLSMLLLLAIPLPSHEVKNQSTSPLGEKTTTT